MDKKTQVEGLRSSASGVLQLALLLSVLQALDGVMTSLGISRFGLSVEGNPLVRSLMEQFGPLTALAGLKTLGVLSVIVLAFSARGLPWVKNAMGILSCFYFFIAILPWTYILLLWTWS